MKIIGGLILMAIVFYLETGEQYGGYVIQQDLWKAQDGQVWMGRDGKPPEEMGPNPQYLNTRFVTGNNQKLIPVYQDRAERKAEREGA